MPESGQARATISCSAQDLNMWDIGVGDYMVQGGAYDVAVAQYSGDPQRSMSTVYVTSRIPETQHPGSHRARPGGK